MKKLLPLLLLLLAGTCARSQEVVDSTGGNHGTIKIQKAAMLHSVLYDDVNFRLVGRDVYGNIIDTAIVSFDLNVSIKGIAYSESDAGCFISKPMQQRLSRLDGVIVLMFSNIKAREKDGTIVTMPPLKATSGTMRESTDY